MCCKTKTRSHLIHDQASERHGSIPEMTLQSAFKTGMQSSLSCHLRPVPLTSSAVGQTTANLLTLRSLSTLLEVKPQEVNIKYMFMVLKFVHTYISFI